MNILLSILLQVVLILLNAIFACTEIAVISMNETKLSKMAAEGNKKAIRLLKLTRQPAKFLATIQVAITLSGFLGSAFAADNFSEPLVNWLVSLGVPVPVPTLNSISVVIITLILSYFSLVFGELVPKRIAMKKTEQLALGVATMISAISKLFAPLVGLLTLSTNGILKLIGIDPNANEDEVSEEEIRMLVDAGSEKGVIDKEEQEMIQNVFEFDDLTVDEFATHRTEVTMLWEDETLEQWDSTIRESRHCMYPVCSETADNIIGILNTKDYFRMEHRTKEDVIKKALRPAYFVPCSIRADVLFRQMQMNRKHFAVVLDEYGGVLGIVTMNDLLEQIVGDIPDESEPENEEPEIEKIDSQTWKIRGCAPLDDVCKQLDIQLPVEEYDTFGGMIFGCNGSIPEDGTQFEIDIENLHIKVIEILDHKVEKAIVCKQN